MSREIEPRRGDAVRIVHDTGDLHGTGVVLPDKPRRCTCGGLSWRLRITMTLNGAVPDGTRMFVCARHIRPAE